MSESAAERWLETCRLFDELSDLDAAARHQRLVDLATTDPELKRKVESLLAGDRTADERLARFEAGVAGVLHRHDVIPRPVLPDPLRLVGRTLSHFRVLALLGAGGMGAVYLAEDTRLGRKVALKLPLTALQLDVRALARFHREAEAAGALDHPNVCSVYEAGEADDGQPFIAMALCDGEPLRSRLAGAAPLPPAEALDIARQVALGLACAHEAGVVHRDLKPGNVMLLPDGTAKILDFGLAKLSAADGSASGATLGTVAYMAPEQVRGQTVDARADLWALGVTLHEMLTGVRPFHADDFVATTHAILHDEPPPPSRLRPGLPRSVDDVVAGLLQKDPAQRYASARAVAEDLNALTLGMTPRHARRARRPLRRLRARDWRTRAGLAALGVAIVTTGVIAAPRLAALARGRPTDSAEAYRYYLRGRELEQAGRIAAADTLYDRALVLDPDFALPHARLALVHLNYTPRPDSARLERARQEAIAALRTQPGLADAHYALGLYWQRRNQHARALAEFGSARRGMRNSAALHRAIAFSYRALGRWEDAVTALERVRELEPMNVDYAQQLAFTYSRLRRYGEATNAWDRYIALNPDAYTAMMIRGHVFVRWQGTADTLAAALERLPDGWDGNGMASLAHFMVARLRRRPEQGLAALTASTRTLSEDDLVYFPHALMRAMLHDDAGDSLRARATYDTARIALQDSLALHPDDPRMHIAHGLALAALGRRHDAMNAAARALSLAPTTTDVVRGTAFMGGAAMIFARVGENDAALGLIERLLRMPAGREASVPLLRADPAWDPIRADPRFRELLIRYAPE